ncbi:MAG: hypothetical protein WBZ36_26350 [Candidatus Nitrosopolaris sp.]
MDSKIKEIHKNSKQRKYSVHYESDNKIRWIELLQVPIAKLSINLFIYESGPNDEKIKDVLFMQIQILNLVENKI